MILAIIMSPHFSVEQKIRSVSGAKNTYSNPEKAKIKTNIMRLLHEIEICKCNIYWGMYVYNLMGVIVKYIHQSYKCVMQ